MNEEQIRHALRSIAARRAEIGLLEVLLNIGALYAQHGPARIAEHIFRKCIDRFPENFKAHWHLAQLHEQAGNTAYCKQLYSQVYQNTRYDGAALKLAHLSTADGDINGAIVWLERIQKPDANIIKTLVRAYNHIFDMDSVARLAHEHKLFCRDMVATYVPDSDDSIDRYYRDYENCLNQLEISGKTYSLEELTIHYPVPLLFRFSYYNRNNRSFFSRQCEVFRCICPELNYTSPNIDERRPSEKIRVGFISAFFKNHSVARDRGGVIANLDRDRFHVTTIFLEPPADPIGRFIWDHSDHHLLLRGRVERSIDAWRSAIEGLQLDVLVYCDIGMSLDTYLLAYSRLAPLQCNTWGHSDTSGIDTIDWYISSELYELDGKGREHYSEQLVLTKSLCTYYINHTVKLSRQGGGADIGEKYWLNNQENNIYFSLQTVNKFHPLMDEVYARILVADPRAVIVMSFVPHPVRKKFFERIKAVLGPNLNRLVVLPEQLPVVDFLELMRFSKIILDSHPFGGCNSCFEAFYLGKCVVTLPSAFISGRFTFGMYKKMGIAELVATSIDDYVAKAIELVDDDVRRQALEHRIREQSGLLFEDDLSLHEWNELLAQLPLEARQRDT